jgi:iron(III) transport system ATP-binding protein
MSALELKAVCKVYGSVRAMQDVDLTVAAGSRTAIVGASGSGKSTLLRVIAGFELPDAGSVVLNGQTLADAAGAMPAHRRRVGFVPQDRALFPHLTVADNIGFGLTGSAAQQRPRVDELLEMVALDRALGARWPHELSGGQQQRIALARALAQRPQLMLLDEPFSALDTGLRAATRKAVAQLLSDAGVTTILVTHDQAEALSFADQLAVMRDGRLVQAGAPRDLYLRPVDAATAAFLGDAIVLPARIAGGRADCALGRIAVNSNDQRDDACILLRPEQLVLTAASTADGCSGIVIEQDFGGADSNLVIRLNQGTGAPQLLTVRCSSLDAPAVGATVGIGIKGSAHLLADTAPH